MNGKPGPATLDRLDRAILTLLGANAALSLAEIAAAVGLTQTPCWKRIKRLEQEGVIQKRIAVLDQARLGLPISAFVAIETADHSADWIQRFAEVLRDFPEVIEAWRMSGDIDYLLHVVVADIGSYDQFYRRLIGAVKLRNVTTRFAMERLKDAPLPL